MIRISVAVAVCALAATSVHADCPANAPSVKGRMTFETGDQRVNGAWLEKNLSGRRVKFDEGTESYQKDGTYSYRAGSQRYDAPGYRFYDNGLRCIDYSMPRFDMYVVNSGKLILINASGGRYEGKILK